MLKSEEVIPTFLNPEILSQAKMKATALPYPVWLLDVYPDQIGVRTFWTTTHGQTLEFLLTGVKAHVYIQPNNKNDFFGIIKQLNALIQDEEYHCDLRIAEKYLQLHHTKKSYVIELLVPFYELNKILTKVIGLKLPVTLYNTDLSLPQMLFLETGLFPFCKTQLVIQHAKIVSYTIIDDIHAINYELPPVKAYGLEFRFDSTMHLATPRTAIITPMHQNIVTVGKYDQLYTNESIIIERMGTETTFIQRLIQTIDELDPDIIVTSGGDRELRFIAKRATELGLGGLSFNRDKKVMPFTQNSGSFIGTSYMSYGGHFYKDMSFYFHCGRHHFDLRNSFTWMDGGFSGIVELARLSCMTPQACCRGSIGTLLTGMQILEALRSDILIPQRKADVERFRTGSSLLQGDRGGFIVAPKVGIHFNVIELDFLSMFPTIMVNFNVSPETMNCYCCADGSGRPVPGTLYYTCTKHQGLVPRVLDRILQRRIYYKQRKKESEKFNQLQKTLKWILVTCFGYLGYRNARWGRIDAHETINAYAREKILKVVELGEENSLEPVGGIVDSIWLKFPNENTIDEFLPTFLTLKGAEITDLPISIEGVYKWIVFLPRLDEPLVGVLNRYYGVFLDGSMKVRGIELRKRDTPLFIKTAQQEALNILAMANNRKEFGQKIRQALPALLDQWEQKILHNEIPYEQMLIKKTLSKHPSQYMQNNHQALAALQLINEGVHLQSGMKVNYLVSNAAASDYTKRVKPAQKITSENYQQYVDHDWYIKKLREAFKNIIPPEYQDISEKLTKKLPLSQYTI
ncbi:MAG: DNA polymerase domain-containing protein [Candidatus Thorarchaeota archaeon]